MENCHHPPLPCPGAQLHLGASFGALWVLPTAISPFQPDGNTELFPVSALAQNQLGREGGEMGPPGWEDV